MVSSADISRPPAKNLKTEALLRLVEGGSVEDIYRLSRGGWPTNLDDGALALTAVFDVLRREVMPQPTKVCTAQCFHDNRIVTRVRYCMDAVMAAVEQLNENERVKQSLSQVILENLSTLVRWMRFLSEESRWAYPDMDSPEAFGPMTTVETLQSIYVSCSSDLMCGINTSTEVLELLSYLWVWRDSDGKTLTWRFSSDGACCHIGSLFPFMATSVPFTANNLALLLSGRTYHHHLAFINSSLARLEEWTSLALAGRLEFLSLQAYTFSAIAMTQQYELLQVPAYADAYINTKFPSRALALAMKFPDLNVSASSKSNGFATFPVAISVKFFPNDASDHSAKITHKVVPELVKAGLVQLMMDHLLSQPVETPYPWYAWVKEDSMGHPLQVLSSMCVYEPICDAILAFADTIPVHKKALLASGYYKKHWTPFFESVTMYDEIWQRLSASGKQMKLCDNLNHRRRSQGRTLTGSRECSGCQTVIYCSKECQREDWKAFHKAECPQNRVYRIDRVLDSSWVTHRDRVYLLSLLQRMVLNYEAGYPSMHQFEPPDRPEPLTSFMECDHPLVDHHHHQGHISKTNHLILHLNTLFCPPQPFRHTLDSVLGYAHGGVPTFRNPRFLAMFKNFLTSVGEDEAKNRGRYPQRRMKVALCTAFCGMYRIYVVGRYEIVKQARKTRVELVNGVVKIEERRKLDGETMMMPVYH